jgi:hypothetical protein
MKYEVIENEFYKFIKRTEPDGKVWLIPFDEANSDYQLYLAHLAGDDKDSVIKADK